MGGLLDLVGSFAPDSLLRSVASTLGEDEAAVKRSIDALAPLLLSGMSRKVDAQDGQDSLFGAIDQVGKMDILNNLGGLVGGGNLAHGDPKDIAGQVVGSLFGDKVGGLLSVLAQFAGFRSQGSAGGILGMAAPMVMGLISQKITDSGLNPAGLRSLLMGERDSFDAAIPPGLALAVGFPVRAAAGEEENEPAGLGWLWGLAALAILVGIIWLAMRSTAPETGPAAAPTDSVPVAVEAPLPPPAEFSRDLNGVRILGAAGGVKEQLIAFIE